MSRKIAGQILIGIVALLIVRSLALRFSDSVDPLSVGQYISFPVAVFIFWRWRVLGQEFPKLLILVAIVLFSAAGWMRFRAPSVRSGEGIVAPFRDDPMQHESSRLVERIHRSAERLSLAVRSLKGVAEPVGSNKQAREVLSKYPAASTLIWGSNRWIHASFPHRPELLLSSFPEGSQAWELRELFNVPDFLIVTSVPEIGLSTSPPEATANFLALLINLDDGAFTSDRPVSESTSRALRIMALQRAPWTTNAHLAYPMWRIGTAALVELLVAKYYQFSEMKCVTRAFESALLRLQPGDNPELRAAILNNLAVARYLEGTAERQPALKAVALDLWNKSVQTQREKNLLRVPLRAFKVSIYNRLVATRAQRRKMRGQGLAAAKPARPLRPGKDNKLGAVKLPKPRKKRAFPQR